MPQDPNNTNERGSFQMSAEEYRRLQAARAERRRKRQRQRLLVLGAFVLAAILLIVCIVLVVRSITKKKDDKPAAPDSSVSQLEGGGAPTPNYPTASDPSVWNLKLVNENNPLPAGFEVDFEWGEIVVMEDNVAVTYWFDERIVESLQQMMADCNAAVENGSLRIGSGFRSYDRQQKNFDYQVSLGYTEDEVRRFESTPGASDHHTGLAVKFLTDSVNEFDELFATTPEYQWLVENAANYGFILRYPGEKEAITGMDYMPYHWRYVGAEDAAKMNAAGVCLEEYVSAVSSDIIAGANTMPDDGVPADGGDEATSGQPEGDEGEGGGDEGEANGTAADDGAEGGA